MISKKIFGDYHGTAQGDLGVKLKRLPTPNQTAVNRMQERGAVEITDLGKCTDLTTDLCGAGVNPKVRDNLCSALSNSKPLFTALSVLENRGFTLSISDEARDQDIAERATLSRDTKSITLHFDPSESAEEFGARVAEDALTVLASYPGVTVSSKLAANYLKAISEDLDV
ncbi:hypothetical protein [Yoonia sp. BS5-3]|uniref:Uncharacterized protein n=1 Tax=Yoonia phaeophyticola TaxID=3137369 RepID=A0ABZ2VBW4_9RHOB